MFQSIEVMHRIEWACNVLEIKVRCYRSRSDADGFQGGDDRKVQYSGPRTSPVGPHICSRRCRSAPHKRLLHARHIARLQSQVRPDYIPTYVQLTGSMKLAMVA